MKIKRSLSIFIVFLMIFTISSFGNFQIKAYAENEVQAGDLEAFDYYPNSYNKNLALMAAKYSMLAYEGYDWNEQDNLYYTTKVDNTTISLTLKNKLEKQGFTNVKDFNYNDNLEDNVSFIIASKDVSYFGEPRKLVSVIIRGTDGIEWLGNMDVTGKEYDSTQINHTNFDNAKLQVETELKSYLENLDIDNKLLLITGHSRGAAVANLLADDINAKKNTPEYRIGDVFAYTFATPNSTKSPNAEDTNIFNFCFEDDFVPQVPLKQWGYDKNGRTATAVAQDLYNKNSDFKSDMQKFIKKTTNSRENAEFNYEGTLNLIKYVGDKWQTTESYYNDVNLIDENFDDNTLYKFFRNLVAKSAMGDMVSGMAVAQKASDGVYGEIARFFIGGSGIGGSKHYIGDTHEMVTYYSAIKNDCFDLSVFEENTLK